MGGGEGILTIICIIPLMPHYSHLAYTNKNTNISITALSSMMHTHQTEEYQAAILCQAAHMLAPIGSSNKIQDHINTSWRDGRMHVVIRAGQTELLKVTEVRSHHYTPLPDTAPPIHAHPPRQEHIQ